MVNTPMAVAVTKNYDPDIVKAMVARAPIGRFGEAKRSQQPSYGFARQQRVS
jgi:hypothetical protein